MIGNNESGEPLVRVMALHALAYCERLFYLEEVEEIRLADASIYAGRQLHEELKQADEESGQIRTMELSSESIGLIGKMDCLKRRDGVLIPYEHKRGRPRRDGKTAVAWQSDSIQVSAYGMLLEQATGETISEGRIRYHAENVTVSVPLDDRARQTVQQAVVRARELRNSKDRPPITSNDHLCIRCALAPVCLPEEERLLGDPDWEPVRLFPADREVKTIHVLENGARISRSGSMLKIVSTNDITLTYPIHEVGALVLHGYPQITTQALHFCARNSVLIQWLSSAGNFVAGLAPGSATVQRRLRQYQALSEPGICLRLARKLAMAKVEVALRYILRTTRGSERSQVIMDSIKVIRNSLREMAHAEGINQLRGYEGIAGRAYFTLLPFIIQPAVSDEFRFSRRSRRPPQDRFNALLSFGYALIYQAVLQSITAVGLEPSLGFYHTPRSAAHPLVLDIMELFRVPLCDIVVIGSINRMQWDVNSDFDIAPGRIWLSGSGRKKAIHLFETRLEEKWKHPVVKYSLSYARLIELEVRLLEKEWSGQPGLFAKMRLR
ncbi:MAG: type I-MYXAN CRISPR-associated endonuclease Cas1 [Planctomycetota bacterium]